MSCSGGPLPINQQLTLTLECVRFNITIFMIHHQQNHDCPACYHTNFLNAHNYVFTSMIRLHRQSSDVLVKADVMREGCGWRG